VNGVPLAGTEHRLVRVVCRSTKGIVTVVDVVGSAASVDEFPGIYAEHLDETCWSEDSQRVVLSSVWRSRRELIMVHVETGAVTRLTNDLAVGAWNLLDIRKDLMLAACSSPSQPPYLVVGKLPAAGEPMTVKWLRLDAEPEPLAQVERVVCSVLCFSHRRSEGWPHHGRTFCSYLCPLSF